MAKTTMFLVTLLGSTSAWIAPSRLSSMGRPSLVQLYSEPELNAMSRQAFWKSASSTMAAVMTTSSILLTPTASQAAKYGSFGTGSPAALDPADAVVDASILASSKVQEALKKVKGYKVVVNNLVKTLESDPQANIKPVLLKELEFSALRESLNTVNSAFEEDTQRGTDRLIRVIMQDITELEVANNVKEGVERSPRRLENMKGKLAKLSQAFDDYLAFAK